ncbi:hypothetical protein QR680_001164 [Steinernema hermaphroditum]|uniref:Pre-rRNA-processing protein TSR1 homolog n=1 Tax=Steinernema hermaphroditum TaxID=289476 RepID=A0AA39GX57_9BILA|nr:hypothetical protein QR680_001164 [Steinernema hermaphroditum]
MSGHKPGPFNAPNKRHKTGGHRSKGQIDREAKGRSGASLITSKRSSLDESRRDRKNRASERRRAQRQKLIEEKRRSAGKDAPPVFVTIICLDKNRSSVQVLQDIQDNTSDEGVYAWFPQNSTITHMASMRQKCRFSFSLPSLTNGNDVLDSLKVSDVVLFVWPRVKENLIDGTEALISILLRHSVPTCLHYAYPQQLKKSEEAILVYIRKMNVPNEDTVGTFKSSCPDELLRKIAECKKVQLNIQKSRGYMISNRVEFMSADLGDVKDPLLPTKGELKLTGWIRGQGLVRDGIMHVSGLGDYAISRIEILNDVMLVKNVNKSLWTPNNQYDVIATHVNDDPERKYREHPPVPERNIAEDEQNIGPEGDEDIIITEDGGRVTRRVPRGTSTYQAAWLDLDEEDEASDETDNDEESGDDEMEEDVDDEMAEREEMDIEEPERHVWFNDVDEAEDIEMNEEDLVLDMDEATMFHKARGDNEFPDEIDTPIDVPARERFQKYRAVANFRSSVWDPKENLPHEYSHIYSMENFKQARKIALSHPERVPNELQRGVLVSIYLSNVVEQELFAKYGRPDGSFGPVVAYQLLDYEHCRTAFHMRLKKCDSYRHAIKNKEKLIFHVGYRIFEASAVFSEHTNANKFKMLRYMPEEDNFVASVFAPTIFGVIPVLVFKEASDGSHRLVAHGVTMPPNADRIILKRVVLSGHPLHQRGATAVVRYMFYNPEDVAWFSPVELYTSGSRRGNITQSLGTHGLFKARFDGPLGVANAVYMALYKRVYPKLSYETIVPRNVVLSAIV